MIPLPIEKANELLDLMGKGSMEGLESTEVTKLISLFYAWYEAQQQAHDQQVRKAFAKEVHSFIKEAVQFVSPKTEVSVLAHILEMAEEK
jgi:hypothetical protein